MKPKTPKQNNVCMLLWMAKHKINTSGYAVTSLDDFSARLLTKSHLKQNAALVKSKLNYKFQLLHDDFLQDHPNIEEIEFVHSIGEFAAI